eukprot:357033-Chlamydomonas_euryale.AAC.9
MEIIASRKANVTVTVTERCLQVVLGPRRMRCSRWTTWCSRVLGSALRRGAWAASVAWTSAALFVQSHLIQECAPTQGLQDQADGLRVSPIGGTGHKCRLALLCRTGEGVQGAAKVANDRERDAVEAIYIYTTCTGIRRGVWAGGRMTDGRLGGWTGLGITGQGGVRVGFRWFFRAGCRHVGGLLVAAWEGRQGAALLGVHTPHLQRGSGADGS